MDKLKPLETIKVIAHTEASFNQVFDDLVRRGYIGLMSPVHDFTGEIPEYSQNMIVPSMEHQS